MPGKFFKMMQVVKNEKNEKNAQTIDEGYKAYHS